MCLTKNKLTRIFSFYPQVNIFFIDKLFFFILNYFFKLSDLLQKFTGDTSKSHNTKSIDIFEKYLKTFATENFKIFRKILC